MKPLIPIPYCDNIPPYDEREPFCTMLDTIFGAVYADIVGLNYLNDPLRCRAECLDALVEVVGGDVNPADSDALKRVKAYNAQNSDFKPSLWKTIKNLIDSITGASASLYSDTADKRNDWGLQSDNTSLTLDGKTVITQIMADANGLDVGLLLLAQDITMPDGASPEAPVRIDVGVALTPPQIARVTQTIISQIPAYKRVAIGFYTGSTFITYDTIF
jgi:hypothetical protein